MSLRILLRTDSVIGGSNILRGIGFGFHPAPVWIFIFGIGITQNHILWRPNFKSYPTPTAGAGMQVGFTFNDQSKSSFLLNLIVDDAGNGLDGLVTFTVIDTGFARQSPGANVGTSLGQCLADRLCSCANPVNDGFCTMNDVGNIHTVNSPSIRFVFANPPKNRVAASSYFIAAA